MAQHYRRHQPRPRLRQRHCAFLMRRNRYGGIMRPATARRCVSGGHSKYGSQRVTPQDAKL
ncbi:hypothetical protein KCP73_23285 [Salmonella enterica subsp. enterica]|nr:hypothetical protein KCP73_23285 [Salmonella enterica subsp. enterica]